MKGRQVGSYVSARYPCGRIGMAKSVLNGKERTECAGCAFRRSKYRLRVEEEGRRHGKRSE